jgi:hypothetical protein
MQPQNQTRRGFFGALAALAGVLFGFGRAAAADGVTWAPAHTFYSDISATIAEDSAAVRHLEPQELDVAIGNLEIRSPDGSFLETVVKIDGREQGGLVSIRLDAQLDGTWRVRIESDPAAAVMGQ